MNKINTFKNQRFGIIRAIVIDDELLFVAKDVIAALGFGNNKQAIKQYVASEDQRIISNEFLEGYDSYATAAETFYGVQLINESGLYSLILSSNLPEAKIFQKWVTTEIIPTLVRSNIRAPSVYQPKATSVGEVVNLIKIVKDAMTMQGARSADISSVIKDICVQFSISLPQTFNKQEEPFAVGEAIDFIYSHERGRGKRVVTYDDFKTHKQVQEG